MRAHVGLPTEAGFTRPAHDVRVSARVGLWLGVAFGVCFLTGLLSHAIQPPPGWFEWPTRPVSLYRITQGLHGLAGVAAIPRLLAKLWSVYPKLFARPAVRSPWHAVERGSVLVLIGAAFFQLATGLLNVFHAYPWRFFFPPVHHAVAWIAIGALIVHVGVKLPLIRDGLSDRVDDEPARFRRYYLVGSNVFFWGWRGAPAGCCATGGCMSPAATASSTRSTAAAARSAGRIRPAARFAILPSRATMIRPHRSRDTART